MRIVKVGGNRIEIVVSSPRNLSFGVEEKVRFLEGEVMLHRMEVRAKAANVVEMDSPGVGPSLRVSSRFSHTFVLFTG